MYLSKQRVIQERVIKNEFSKLIRKMNILINAITCNKII